MTQNMPQKWKILALIFTLCFVSLTAGCLSNKTDYNNIQGYWKASVRKDFMAGHISCVAFGQNSVTIGRASSAFELDANAEVLTIKLATGATIAVKDLKGDTVQISLPRDVKLDSKERTFFEYKRISEKEYKDIVKKPERKKTIVPDLSF